MPFEHGSKAVFKIDNASDVLTDISQYLTSVNMPRSVETAEVTTLGATAKAYSPGLEDATIGLEGKFDPTVDALFAGILRKVVDFEYGPQGGGSGAVKYTGQAIVTSYEPETGVDAEGTFSAELQVTGPITRGTYA
jgi:hypothetical protein